MPMLISQRDLLILGGSLTVAACLLTAGIAIYPDSRQMEVGLSAEPQSSNGAGASAFPQVSVFAVRTVHPFGDTVHGAEHASAENDTDVKEAPPVGGQFGRGFPRFQVDLRTVLANLRHPHSVTQTGPRPPG
jgi:hypothetical protein